MWKIHIDKSIKNIIKTNDFTKVEKIIETDKPLLFVLMHESIEKDNKEMMDFLVKFYGTNIKISSPFINCIYLHKNNYLNWCLENKFELKEVYYVAACMRENMEACEWLKGFSCPFSNEIIKILINQKRYKSLRWFYKNFFIIEKDIDNIMNYFIDNIKQGNNKEQKQQKKQLEKIRRKIKKTLKLM